MTPGPSIDGVLVQWGERLFYPRTRMVKAAPPPHLAGGVLHLHAQHIRQRIEATVVRRAAQVMVKVTGGGRGMAAISAHFRYIAKSGRLPFEDDRGIVREGKEALHDLAEQWRHGGSRIGEASPRREAFNIMLSMPAGTDPLIVQRAAREFAQHELADHRWVMVLHDHQANPHVHLSVRAESRHGKRLNPRKADLHRWRETFADKLRAYGIEAEATRQATRGEQRRFESLWQINARKDGRLSSPRGGNQAERRRERKSRRRRQGVASHRLRAREVGRCRRQAVGQGDRRICAADALGRRASSETRARVSSAARPSGNGTAALRCITDATRTGDGKVGVTRATARE